VSTSHPASVPERERLIESHLPLVRAIAKRYAGRGESLDDLVQVGALGLIRASDRFDASRGVAFATFAMPAIEGEIRRHLGDRTTSLRIPRELRRMSGELQRRRAELAASLGRPPTVAELAAAVGVEDADVQRALNAERAAQPSSALPDELAEAVADAESLASTDDRLLLAHGARVLDERERRIVFLRFHADLTEDDIARDLGISQAHVSRLLAGALAKLRAALAHEGAGKAAGEGDINEAPAGPGARISNNDQTSGSEQKGASEKRTKTKMAGVGARSEGSSKQKPGSTHSGRFLVRMPSALHEKLSIAAEREQVSLNRFVTDVLATEVSRTQGASPEPPSDDEVAAGAWPRSPIDLPAGTSAPERTKRLRMLLAANVVLIVVAAAAAVVLLILALQRGI
jgi:RNA polymerase sigma-B factor